MCLPRKAIEAYIRAKDENRPYLMERAFTRDVALEVVAKAGTIALPPCSRGLESVSDVLVRRFAQTYENVHTFCLASPPQGYEQGFSCKWLVGMSEKASRAVRVGCGRYDWLFQPCAPYLAVKLTITIEQMESVAPMHLAPVMRWLDQLSYPWCAIDDAAQRIPALDGLQEIHGFLARDAA